MAIISSSFTTSHVLALLILILPYFDSQGINVRNNVSRFCTFLPSGPLLFLLLSRIPVLLNLGGPRLLLLGSCWEVTLRDEYLSWKPYWERLPAMVTSWLVAYANSLLEVTLGGCIISTVKSLVFKHRSSMQWRAIHFCELAASAAQLSEQAAWAQDAG